MRRFPCIVEYGTKYCGEYGNYWRLQKMNFKMRVFFFKTEGVAEELMEQLSREYRVKADQIPPAYPVENEKLILVCIDDGASKPKKALVDFCRNLDNARCQNVAFSATTKGGVEAAKELANIIRSNNINVVDEPHLVPVKSGLFRL